ncbi:MAG: M28 family peptidase [Planctomycetaceae bacterium]|nr:M28 family peptidase [Planctomycetaceae bacterium]
MTPPAPHRRRLTRPAWLLGGVIVATALLGTYLLFAQSGSSQRHRSATVGPALSEIPFNGQRAYRYLQQICDLGPRPSGSPAMAAQQKLLAEHFANLGGKVTRQEFRYRHPLDGSTVPMANLLVEWHPERKERVLLCAHYDTRPFPDRDPVDPRGSFVGANDGGSGVALLMELAHEMPDFQSRYGVDFVLFDGEEFVFSDTDTYFLGSEWFARQYVGNPPPYHYRWGVLFDMVADADLQLFQEGNSVSWSDTRPLVDSIWQTAARLRVPEFIPRRGQTVRDDHLKLHNIAKIPTCDIIDFDYPYWHTVEDLPRRCSAESLAKVGWVTREWLRGLK